MTGRGLDERVPEILSGQKKQQEAVLGEYSEIGTIVSQLERLSNALMIQEVDILKEQVQDNKNTSGLAGFWFDWLQRAAGGAFYFVDQ